MFVPVSHRLRGLDVDRDIARLVGMVDNRRRVSRLLLRRIVDVVR